jgi:UDP-N-acetylglucosamine/UDP-N-acetylgalactosamine diphosphorylase
VLSSGAMSDEQRYQDCRAQLERHGQIHVLAAWERLTDSERSQLLGEIETIPWDRVAPLIETHVRRKPVEEALHNLTPPPFFAAHPASKTQTAQYRDASMLGRQCLRDGRVAAFTVAGGQGSRLGVNGPKGCVEVTPVRNKSLFQLFAETVRAVRDRYGAPIRWYIMTSPANHDDTLAFFEQHAYFGLPREDVVAFPQGMLPSFDFQGRILLAEPHRLALAPDGHGGALRALSESGALADMEQRGVDILSYFQVDNPLVQPFDPLFIGLHAGERSEMSSKVTRKAHALEKVGNLCIHNGRLQVIEYSDFPDELAHATNGDGTRTFDLGSIAIHLLDVAFAARLGGADHELPYHRAEKKVPHVDPDTGMQHAPCEPNGVKLESFVFDAIPLAANPILLEVERAEEFSPVKNPDSDASDSAATARRDQVRRAAAWLEAAGAEIPRDVSGEPRVRIELAPSYALARGDVDPARAKAQRFEGDVYLE